MRWGKWRCALAVMAAMTALLAVTAQAERLTTPGRETCGKPDCFWETEMDIHDEEALGRMLMAPIVVAKGSTTKPTYLYAEPDKSSQRVADVTPQAQGLHVLEEREDGWSRVECYSSSFHDSKVKNWNGLTTGYIETSLLETKQVKSRYGLIVDKLTQRLYLFEDGKLLDVLAVSTGLPNDEQPYNETRSGEFLLYSRAGAFPSGNLTCNYGIRYNDGDMLHEVPHTTGKTGEGAYKRCEAQLGKRASHGCIRVQRKRTPNGINMKWIWNALADTNSTRIVVWEDWPGRQIEIPEDDMPLYYNAKGGQYYHAAARCYGVRDKYLPMSEFTYGELDQKPYAKLKQCPYCYPALRRDAIEKINLAHQ